MKRISAIFAIVTLFVASLFAQTKINGIYYNLNDETKTAEVTYQIYNSSDNYSGITSITIPEKVTYNTTEYSVTSISNDAFYKCSSLYSITIPNSVTTIGWFAFFGCSSLVEVDIPYSVTTIRERAFNNCKSLETINVDENNPNYASIDGILYDKNITKLIHYPIKHKSTSIVIPESVTTIDIFAFFECEFLSSVVMSNSITNIGIWAFHWCSSLTEITFSENLERIEGHAFPGCSALTNITLPNSVTFIGDWTFADCTSLKSIKLSDNLTTIDPNAFNGCSVLTKIEIPHKVELIRENAFGNCPKLNTIVFYGETPQVETDLGLDVSTCLLVVPTAFYDNYKNHEYWGNFLNIRKVWG